MDDGGSHPQSHIPSLVSSTQALQYLLNRSEAPMSKTSDPSSGGSLFGSIGRSMSRSASSLRFRRSDALMLQDAINDATVKGKGRESHLDSSKMYKHDSQSEPKLTPKPSKRRLSTATGSILLDSAKRSGTPAAEYQHYIQEVGSPRSVRSYRPSSRLSMGGSLAADESLEIVDRREAIGQDGHGYEGLENVRACCNGEHDVGRLSVSRKQHSHNHQHNHHSGNSASRNNSVASRASSRLSKSKIPPMPTLPSTSLLTAAVGGNEVEEPSSPSLRARSLSSTQRHKSKQGTIEPVPKLPAGLAQPDAMKSGAGTLKAQRSNV